MAKRREHLSHISDQVGNRLRLYRVHRGRSQENLAAALGVSFQQVQKYEGGINSIASARIPSVCTELGISPNDLFGWNGSAEPLPEISGYAYRLAMLVDDLPSVWRAPIVQLIEAASGAPIEVDAQPQRRKRNRIGKRKVS